MLFNSYEFLIFFPLVTILYHLVPRSIKWLHLLLASCIFYAAFIPSYLFILLALIIIDYVAGIIIEKSLQKKRVLLISIVANIGMLAVFKYFDFFVSNLNEATGSHFLLLNIALPIGLSFHTFQSLSYTIEVYRGKQKAIRHLGYYALYVMFYPQLVAGPIERPGHLLPQIISPPKSIFKNIHEGLRLMLWGFFKKVVIADRISDYVDACFNDPAHTNPLMLWMGVFFFSIQIYADFSGYSDIAIGAAKCMGYNLSLNFNRPYLSRNIKEFWQRWHISLSTWFRDYVYIPLGGNRNRHYINLIITFTLSGFWHGANWNFLLWGILHGLYMILYNLYSAFFSSKKLPAMLSWLITGLAVGMAWIVFRANNMHILAAYFERVIQFNAFHFSILPKNTQLAYGHFMLLLTVGWIAFMFWVEAKTDGRLMLLNKKPLWDVLLIVVITLWILFFGVFNHNRFIYFQF